VAFHSQKKRKLWVWIAIDRLDQEVIACTVGGRSKKTLKRLLGLLNRYRIVQMATDGLNVYKQYQALSGQIQTAHRMLFKVPHNG